MSHPIHHIAVIGAGTMGAAIAAHCANAGFRVLLLDIIADQLTPEEEARGLSLTSPAIRNRIVQAGFERLKKARPAAIMSRDAEELVTLGNLEDDFDRLSRADWIIEAIIEELEPKQALMARLEAVRKAGSIISSNTSGLPIASIAAGCSEDFRQHFAGTHFFNPPRYMKLVEIIPSADTLPAVTSTLVDFIENRLGKGAVYCKDSPNFIGNRLFCLSNCFTVNYAMEHGYTIQDVDFLTGPLLGRPKTGTFRLLDLVGIDVAAHVVHNLYDLISHDKHRDTLHAANFDALLDRLLENGWLGNKSGQGFYKQGKGPQGERVFLTLDMDTLEYQLPTKTKYAAVNAVKDIGNLGQRISTLLSEKWQQDPAAKLTWAVIAYELLYAAACAQEIAHDLKSIDDAVRWGFNFQVGPFQLWDLLGVAETVDRIEASGQVIAPWVKDMLAASCHSFYRVEAGQVTGFYNWETQQYQAMPANRKHLSLQTIKQTGQPLQQNSSATLLDIADGVLLLEFHSKMNSLDLDIISLMGEAQTILNSNNKYVGLVIGNEGQDFCVGANLFLLGLAAQQGQMNQVEALAKSLQDVLQGYRYSSKPVVVALHNRTLAGGTEIALAASRVVAHAESYIGLVEVGVGLIPSGGGTTALVRRILSGGMQTNHADPLPLAQQLFETIGLAKVSSSAAEARDLGYLTGTDRIVMNRDHLLYEAKQEVLAMAAAGYTPPPRTPLYAAGQDLFATLKMGAWLMEQAGYISDHDRLIGDKLAHLICGGNLTAAQWVDEQYFLDLERDAFVALATTPKTQERIWHMLQNGKPLRN